MEKKKFQNIYLEYEIGRKCNDHPQENSLIIDNYLICIAY